VTQGDYEALTGTNRSHFKGDRNLPVERVNWSDARHFCYLLTERERANGALPDGWWYWLPMEEEWEYACRAGTTTSLNSGKEISSEIGECPNLSEVAWYCENSVSKTHCVGTKAPNGWGLHDMHGNVSEWCMEWYEDRVIGGRGRISLGVGQKRIRGGNWSSYAKGCRAASGLKISDCAQDFVGFRVALVLLR
jgi:formylglycine-generating enzyme required for sulfatase activity